jgi:hypothetical protein
VFLYYNLNHHIVIETLSRIGQLETAHSEAGPGWFNELGSWITQ